MNKQISALIPSFVLMTSFACTGDVNRPGPGGGQNMTMATVSSIVVTTDNSEIVMGQTSTLKAEARMSDGTAKDVSTEANWSSGNEGIASVDLIGRVTGQTVGVATITASFGGQSGSIDITVTLDASKQTLVISPANAVIEANATQQFVATLMHADGSMDIITSSVSWSSSDTNVVTVGNLTSSGLATAGPSAGTATVTATLPSNGLSAHASVTVTAASLDTIEILPARGRIPLGSTGQFTAEGVYSDGMRADLTAMVQWSSSATTTASIENAPNQAGRVSTYAIGNTSITATHVSTGISATITLTVTNPAVLSIKISPNTAMVGIGRNQRFQATAVYTDSSEIDVSRIVTWNTSEPSVASVSNQSGTAGTANGLTVGTATISALHAASGVSSDDTQDSATLVVLPAALTSIAVTPLQTSVPLGDIQIYVATGIYSNGSNQNISSQVTWTSSNPSVATVSTGTPTPGIATTLSQGMTTISVVDPGTGISSNDSMRSALLTVLPPELASIEVRPSIANLVVMGQQQFTAIAHYSNGTQQDVTNGVTWGSTNSNVVAINQSGRGTANIVGMATISARDVGANISSDDSNQSARVTVSVATLTSISITPTSTTVPAGITTPFTATGHYDNGSTNDMTQLVEWLSSDTNVATVSNQTGTRGHVTTSNAGMTTISARDPSTGIDSNTTGVSATVNVSALTLQLLSIAPTMPMPVRVGDSLQFIGTGTFSDGSIHDVTRFVRWTSSNASVASITTSTINGGLLQGLAIGTTNVSAQNVMAGVTSNLVNVNVTTACNVTDLRISEVHVGSDYARITNPTSCTLSLSGLRMRFDDNSLSDVDYSFAAGVTLSANQSLYVCEQSISNCGNVGAGGFANDVCVGTNIFYSGTSGRSGTTYLCNGSCNTAANIIDLHQFTYATSTNAPSPPGIISFTG